MYPNPVEVGDDQTQGDFRLLPDLAKFVLSSMPTSCVLAKATISTLQSLRQNFTNVVFYFIIAQYSLIPFPSISVPFFAVGLTFSTGD
jgi:hypothetical protein